MVRQTVWPRGQLAIRALIHVLFTLATIQTSPKHAVYYVLSSYDVPFLYFKLLSKKHYNFLGNINETDLGTSFIFNNSRIQLFVDVRIVNMSPL